MSYNPTIDDMLNLKIPLSATPSPNGTLIGYLVQQTNFKDNRYETKCFVFNTDTGNSWQLVRDGSVSQIEWYGDDDLAVLKNSFKEKRKSQIYLYEKAKGEGIQLTEHKEDVQSFRIIDKGIIFLSNDPKKVADEERKEIFGNFVHAEQERPKSNLYYFDVIEMRKYHEKILLLGKKQGEKLTKPILDLAPYLELNRTIESIHEASNRSDRIVINTRKRDDLLYLEDTEIYFLEMDFRQSLELLLEDKEKEEPINEDDEKKIVKKFGDFSIIKLGLPKGCRVNNVHANGEEILVSFKIRDQFFYTQSDIAIISIEDAKFEENKVFEILKSNVITSDLDHDCLISKFYGDKALVSYIEYSSSKLAIIDRTGHISPLDFGSKVPSIMPSISQSGLVVAIFDSNHDYAEFGHFTIGDDTVKDLKIFSNFTLQFEHWKVGTSESITWKSRDGLEIEGILRKPADFDPTKQYPLVFIVHGGPTWYSSGSLIYNYLMKYYPALQFLNKGVLILEPNYRGSIGRGQEFKEKYKDDIGHGDLADLESAIDHLDNMKIVDTENVGCMGWSQGGYISAFVSTHSKRFKAVSIGAGISSWYTYYIQNDIRQWALHYLQGSPIENPDYYQYTAPMNKIKEAQTPALIQHGENDQRVPLSNATELHRGFLEVGVPTELFVFSGMPHSITKPRENRAVMHQNMTWFSHYLLNEELDFTKL